MRRCQLSPIAPYRKHNELTNELVNGLDDLRVRLHLEKGVLGHPENEEMPLMRVKLGNGLLLRIIRPNELRR